MVAKSARFLAPIALAAVAVGIYLIVHSTVVPHSSTATNTGAVIANTRRKVVHHRRHTPKYYVVKSGDSLSQISARTHVSVAQLSTLNPAIANAPNSLQTGQRLRLRR